MIKRILLFTGIFLLVGFFILPNLFNAREQAAFSAEKRLKRVYEEFPDAASRDSVTVNVTSFYNRGAFIRYLFGTEYRTIWSEPVTFPVWKLDMNGQQFSLGDAGGGEQTISLDVTDQDGYTYTLRSVNKDQSRALPAWLRYTLARPVFRDQASSLNPYAAPVIARLADKAGIPHTNPVLYFIPLLENAGQEKNELLAGRVMLMEEEPDQFWNFSPQFGTSSRLMDTDDMLEQRAAGNFWVDSLLFARCRIFDVVIGDWDRHEGQWAWACDTISGGCKPLPVDRDMAFYDFREGIIDKIALKLVPKFQSFDSSFSNIPGYVMNGAELQRNLLGQLNESQWRQAAASLQDSLDGRAMSEAFRQYPDNIYDIYGKHHQAILRYRLDRADSIARILYRLTTRIVSDEQ